MQRKTTGARKDDGKQVRDGTVEIAALQGRIALHRTLEGNKFYLDALLCKVSALCGDDERN